MTANTAFGLSAIEQIAITVKDIDRAVAFYRDQLGMKHLFSAPPNLAFFDCGGIRLMLSPPPKPEFDHPSSIIYFKVEDIQLAYVTLSERGVQFEEALPLLPIWAPTIFGWLRSAILKTMFWH